MSYITAPQRAAGRKGRKTLHRDVNCPAAHGYQLVLIDPTEYTTAKCSVCHPNQTQLDQRLYLKIKKERTP